MTKVLVLYYSSYGHIETMANAVAEGVREGGADVTIKRVPELVPEEVAKKSGFKLDQAAPIATVAEMADYDAVIFGVPTRFGNMAAQMKNFLDQAGGLWMQGSLVGKVGAVFTSTATQHGGQESTILSFHATLLHLLGLDHQRLVYRHEGRDFRLTDVFGELVNNLARVDGDADGRGQPAAHGERARRGDDEALHCLCELPAARGVDPRADNHYAMRRAAERGHTAVVQYLCELPAARGVDLIREPNDQHARSGSGRIVPAKAQAATYPARDQACGTGS